MDANVNNAQAQLDCKHLTEAVKNNDIEALKDLIIKYDVSNDYNMNFIYNPFFDAIDEKHIVVLHYLIMLKSQYINMHGDNGDTPLMLAVEKSQINIAKMLIDAGALIIDKNNNYIVDSHGNTVLMHAKTYDMAKMLLTDTPAMSTINACNKKGYTMAMLTDDSDIFRLLIEYGADINKNAPHNKSKLMTTTSLAIADDCIRHGMDVNQYSEYGYPVITYQTNPNIIRTLIHHGADINAQDKYHGRTPLMQIAYLIKKEHSEEIATILLRAGADTTIQDKLTHMTALEIAEHVGNTKIADIIRSYIAKTQPQTNSANSKTLKNDFLEKFPNAQINSSHMCRYESKLCVSDIYGRKFNGCETYKNCDDCWNQPLNTIKNN